MIKTPAEWNRKSIDEASTVIVSPVDKKSYDHEIPVELCNYMDVYYNRLINSKIEFMKATATQNEIDKFSLLPGDVIITKDSETPDDIGVSAYIEEIKPNLLCGYHLSILRPNKNLCGKYLLYSLRHPKIKYDFYRYANGVTRFGLAKESYSKITIPFPPLPEQRAIADILSTWDEAIEKMEKLIEAKEKRFKAKSEIFITEIETSHKDILLGDICEIFTAGSKSSEIVQTGKYIIADMGAISGKGELLDRKRSNNNKDLLNIGDLIMPKDDIGGGNIIGKVAYVSIDSVVLGDHVYALRFKENVNSKFIYYQINGRRINRQLRRMSNGTSQLGLGKKDVKIQKIFLPDKNEQNRIANILDNLKREIVLLGQIKIYYKEQKRGLMQKLLTGAWRVGV